MFEINHETLFTPILKTLFTMLYLKSCNLWAPPYPSPYIPGPSALGPASPSSRAPSTTVALWNPSVFAPSPA